MFHLKSVYRFIPIFLLLAASSCVEEIVEVEVARVYKSSDHIVITTGQQDTICNFDSSKVFLKKGCLRCKNKSFEVHGCSSQQPGWVSSGAGCSITTQEGNTVNFGRPDVILDTGTLSKGEYFLTLMDGAFFGSQVETEFAMFAGTSKSEDETYSEAQAESGTSEGVLYVFEVD